MIKKFDYSLEMLEDIIYIDKKSFNEIEDDALTLNNKLKENKNYELYIRYSDGNPVAYLGILYVSNLHYTGAWIDLIAVIEEARQQGIAKELIKFSQDLVKERGIKYLTSLVNDYNDASNELFKKSNFMYKDSKFNLYYKYL